MEYRGQLHLHCIIVSKATILIGWLYTGFRNNIAFNHCFSIVPRVISKSFDSAWSGNLDLIYAHQTATKDLYNFIELGISVELASRNR